MLWQVFEPGSGASGKSYKKVSDTNLETAKSEGLDSSVRTVCQSSFRVLRYPRH